jgi:flagellar export protein FliJ
MQRFRLQRVLEHRKRREDEMQQRLAVASLARAGAEQRLRTLQDDEQRRREALALLLAVGRVDADRVRAMSLTIELCGRAIITQQDEVSRCIAFENEERAHLTAAMVERKALDRLRERHEERERAEHRHREAIVLDEIGTTRAARERMLT